VSVSAGKPIIEVLLSSCRPDIVLASASPRRRRLLNGIGIHFQVAPSGIDELAVEGETPTEQVTRLALAKAWDVAPQFPGDWVLGADTIVVVDGMILGKPEHEEEATQMLTTLSGRFHEVFTGYALVNTAFAERERVNAVRSEVFIRSLRQEEITRYVRTGEPMDKAGAYAVQGIGAALVQRIIGSYTNVVGLPLCEVTQELRDLGVFDMFGGNGAL
jgi:septum formation protein